VRVLIVSGIWPPDVGGPASHAPEVASYLLDHGHQVRAVVTADTEPAPERFPVSWIPRSSQLRHVRALATIARYSRSADVVYTTGMFGRSGAAAAVVRTPYVIKLTADPAFERARRLGLTHATLAEFQHERASVTFPLRMTRDTIARHAAHVVTPSEYLAALARKWGAPAVSVLPNPAPNVDDVPSRDDARRAFAIEGPTLVFAGRLVPQKALDSAIAATRDAGVGLVIAGDGPERARLETLGHARFLGPLPRGDVLALLRAGDASILSSAWENFPHSVVESLAVGTPVVATAVGGVAEVLHDGVNGLLVPPEDVEALTRAVRRLFAAPGELEQLRANAASSVGAYSADRVYGRLLQILEEAG
jgi:glycosyltransferase involved in cell wall biosynthesis